MSFGDPAADANGSISTLSAAGLRGSEAVPTGSRVRTLAREFSFLEGHENCQWGSL